MTDEPRFHQRGCPQHVHPTQRDPKVIAICTCGGIDPDDRAGSLHDAWLDAGGDYYHGLRFWELLVKRIDEVDRLLGGPKP